MLFSVMKDLIALILLFAWVAEAQPAFTGLATNANGSRLWFSSRLRLRGTDSFAHAKIFTWDASSAATGDPTSISGFRLLEEREARYPTNVLQPFLQSNTFHELFSASVSRDGAVVALNAEEDCVGYQLCLSRPSLATIRQPGSPERTEDGIATLSANGQFVSLLELSFPDRFRILNLTTGASTAEFRGEHTYNQNSRHVIADNGVLIQAKGLRVWPSGEFRPLPVQGCGAINAAGTRAYCVQDSQFNSVDISSGRVTTLFTGLPREPSLSFDISESGDQAVVLDVQGLWFVRSDGTALRRIAGADISEFVLSADGNVVFASTTDSRLLRIDIGSASTMELVPPTPAIRLGLSQPGAAVIGSRFEYREIVNGSIYDFWALSIPEVSQVRLPGGAVGAPFHSGPELISFQVPYDAPAATGWPELVLASQPNGPFVASVLPGMVIVKGFSPFWYTNGTPPLITALHEDFRGPVTTADPSLPGEIVHVYGGGFGPVEPTPPAGQAASANPLSRVTHTPLACTLRSGVPSQDPGAEILFAGLAPGWIGLYQLDIRLPELAALADPARFPVLNCGVPNSRSAFGYLPYRPR
jgi:uncharacterized protein (TIGR03437 family)